MADGKFLSIANAAGAIGGAVVGGLGVMFALGDTSPKSLWGMASSLDTADIFSRATTKLVGLVEETRKCPCATPISRESAHGGRKAIRCTLKNRKMQLLPMKG